MIQMSGPDGTVVNFSSVQEVMAASFDETIRQGAREVVVPLVVHRRADAQLAGGSNEGFLGVLLAPFTFRPGLGSVWWYLWKELSRRARDFEERGKKIECDLHAPLDVQARRNGQKMAYIVLGYLTRRHRWIATAPIVK
jgi:hypothetical protein